MKIAHTKFNCYVCYVVIDTPFGNTDSATWWIEKKSYRVIRQDTGNSKVMFTAIKLGEPLSDELFQFKPPPSARKVGMHP